MISMIWRDKKVFVNKTKIETTIKKRCTWEKGKTVKAAAILMETGLADGTTNRYEPLVFKS